MIITPFRYENVLPNGELDHAARCPHCANNTIVMLDDLECAVPCPFCKAGGLKNNPSASGWAGLARFWGAHRHPSGFSWDGGLTLRHRWFCEHRGQDDRRCNSLGVGRRCAAHESEAVAS